MSRHAPGGALSRRRFMQMGGAAAAATVLGPVWATLAAGPADAKRRWKAFDIRTPEDVIVLINRGSNPRRLHVKVMKSGRLVDEFTRVKPWKLDKLGCRHIEVRYGDPPVGG